MGKAIKFPNDDTLAIELINTPEMIEAGHKITEAMETANMAGDQISLLSAPFFTYISQCRHDAFLQGFDMGVKFIKDTLEEALE